jgi:small subunit ribosomal protein S16
MLRIRLTRTGRKNLSHFRIVIAQHEAPVKGRFIEIIGSFNPRVEKEQGIKIDKERLDFWLSKGAKPSDTVNNLLVDAQIFDAEKRLKKTSKKKRKEKEEKPEKPAVIEAPTKTQPQEGSAMGIPTEEETEKETTDKSIEKPIESQEKEISVEKPTPKSPAVKDQTAEKIDRSKDQK